MKLEQLETLTEKLVEDCFKILVVKGEEYTRDTDKLGNFKICADLCGTTPEQALLVFMTKHYEAIGTFIKRTARGEDPQLTEGIRGRIIDLVNYAFLLNALLHEVEEYRKLDNDSYSAEGVAR